jgi:4-carboxymuconolactone decarboxylase
MTESEQPSERYKRGWELLRELHGEAEDKLRERLAATHPDLAKYIVEYAYGDLRDRPGLDQRTRQLVTIACLATLGYPQRELKIHTELALNAGATREEVVETFLHLSAYAGFPAAVEAMKLALEVFSERDADEGSNV